MCHGCGEEFFDILGGLRPSLKFYGVAPYDSIMELVDEKDRLDRKKHFNGKKVRIGGFFQIFKKNQCCVACGLKGTQFILLDRTVRPGEPKALLPLLCADNFVLLTIDHIIARSRGGPNTFDNYQTMCWNCNRDKGSMDFQEYMAKQTGRFVV